MSAALSRFFVEMVCIQHNQWSLLIETDKVKAMTTLGSTAEIVADMIDIKHLLQSESMLAENHAEATGRRVLSFKNSKHQLVVDEPVTILKIKAEQIKPLPEILSRHGQMKFLKALAIKDKQTALIIDPDFL